MSVRIVVWNDLDRSREHSQEIYSFLLDQKGETTARRTFQRPPSLEVHFYLKLYDTENTTTYLSLWQVCWQRDWLPSIQYRTAPWYLTFFESVKLPI